MADHDDHDDENRIRNLVDNAAISDPYPVQVLGPGEFLASRRPRVAVQGIQPSRESRRGEEGAPWGEPRFHGTEGKKWADAGRQALVFVAG